MKRNLAALVFLIAACAASLAEAQERTVGIGIGYVKPSDVDGTIWFTGNVHFKVANNTVVEPEVGYWNKTSTFLLQQGRAIVPVDVSVSDFNLGANLLYLPPSHGSSVHFAIGAGLGVHFIKGAVGVLGLTDSDSATKFGAHLLAGATFGHAKGMRFFANARYDLVSDISQFKIYGGVRFKI
jgi:hypothetical protein